MPEGSQELYDAALKIARKANYRNAGTVEFLYDVDSKKWYFIEVNPRIQVEHTVTEVVTGIDIVRAQILIAQGHKLHEEPLSLPQQEKVPLYGAALQCRVTTEDPENHFAPDYGSISTYRSPAGSAFGSMAALPYSGALLSGVLRFAARESDRVGHHAAGGVPAHGPRAARIPHPRRENQYSVPGKRGEPSAFPRQRSDHLVPR